MEQATKDYFLYIIKCFYLNLECKSPKEEINFEYLFRLSKIHDVQGIVFTKIKDIETFKSQPLYNELRTYFFSLAMNGITTENNLIILKNILNKHKINHILFKGSVIRDFYPVKELRTMGDVDVLIYGDDFNKLGNILLNEGFNFEKEHSEQYTRTYSLNGTNFEIHPNLVNRNCHIHKTDFVNYFSKAYEHTIPISDYSYTLEPTYHLVFLLYHLLKHFESNGCGIRLFLDFPYFYNHYKSQINLTQFKKTLKELNLTDFCDKVFEFCNYVFGSDLPRFKKENLSPLMMRQFIDRVLTGGTFGHEFKDSDSHRLMLLQLKGQSKLKGYLMWLFPDRETMFLNYGWDIKHPKILLPVGYTKRIFGAIKKRHGIVKWQKNMKNENINPQEFELLQTLGINK